MPSGMGGQGESLISYSELTHLHVLRSKKYCIMANERQFDLVYAVLRILRLRINPYMKRFPAFNFIKDWK